MRGEFGVDKDGAATMAEGDDGGDPLGAAELKVGGLGGGAEGPKPRGVEACALAGGRAVVGLVARGENSAGRGWVPASRSSCFAMMSSVKALSQERARATCPVTPP